MDASVASRDQISILHLPGRIANGCGFLTVGDKQQCNILRAEELPHEVQDSAAVLTVKIAGRFVCQDHFRTSDQSPGDGGALLLASTQLVRKSIFPLLHPHLTQYGCHAFFSLTARHRLKLKWKCDVFFYCQGGEKVEKLKDGGNLSASQLGDFMSRHTHHVFSMKQNAPRISLVHTSEAMEQGALARTGRTHDSGHGSTRQFK